MWLVLVAVTHGDTVMLEGFRLEPLPTRAWLLLHADGFNAVGVHDRS